MLTDAFLRLLEMTKTGSILIMIVIAVRIFLKKMPKKYICILWAAVFFRLLCPLKIELPYSVLPYKPPLSETYALEDASLSVDQTVQYISAAARGSEYVGWLPAGVYTYDQDMVTWWIRPWQVLAWWAKYIWLAGMIVFALYSVISYARLKRRLSASIPDGKRTRISDYIDTPFVTGLFNPVIYLPSSLDASTKEIVLAHEECHIKRKDHILKFISYLAAGIHWFNPLVWLAFSLFEKDMEMSCDEAVISSFGSDIKAAYSTALVEMASHRKIRPSIPLAFDEGNPKSRIENIAGWRSPTRKAVICTVAACLVLAAAMLVSQAKTGDSVTLTSYGSTFNTGWKYELKTDLGSAYDPVYLEAVSYYGGRTEETLIGPIQKDQKEVSVICLMPQSASDNQIQITLKQEGKSDCSAAVPLYPETLKAYGSMPGKIGTVLSLSPDSPADLGVLHLSGSGVMTNYTTDINPEKLDPDEQIVILRVITDPPEVSQDEPVQASDMPVELGGEYLIPFGNEEYGILRIQESGDVLLTLYYFGDERTASGNTAALTDLKLHTLRPEDSVLYEGSSVDGILAEPLTLIDETSGEIIWQIKAGSYRLMPRKDCIVFLVLDDNGEPILNSGMSFERNNLIEIEYAD